MLRQIPNCGMPVRLGRNRNMMFGLLLMHVEQLLRDISLKVVDGKRKNQVRNNGTYITF